MNLDMVDNGPKVPISLLHNDALYMIFITVVELTWGKNEGQVGPSAFPFVASHVCSRWRSISLSEPRLWSYIHLTIPFQPELTKLWHERSSPCSINFRLTTSFDYSFLQHYLQSRTSGDREVGTDEADRFRRCCTQSLVPNLKRYRKIVVRTSMDPRYPFLQHFGVQLVQHFQEYQEPVLSLECFCFDTADNKLCHNWGPVVDPLTIFPNGAPALVAARIGYPFGLQPHVFANLKTLDIAISRLTIQDFHSMVQQCSALNTLVVDGNLHHQDHFDFDLQHLAPLRLPHLSTLKFTGGQSHTLLKLALLFSHTPCREFQFQAFSWRHVADSRRYMDLGIGTFPDLELLTVDLRYIEDAMTEQAAIQVFHSYFPHIYSARFFGLTEKGLTLFGHLWSRLHTLGLGSSLPSNSFTDVIWDVLVTRVKAGNPIKTLEIADESWKHAKSHSGLDPLRSLLRVVEVRKDRVWSGHESNVVEYYSS